MEFLRKLFGIGRSNSSAQEAKGRLISVLIHDRTDISPQLLENLRVEIIALLKKYMDIDESNIDINLDRGQRSVALVANVPVIRVRRGTADYSENNSSEESGTERTASGRSHNKSKRHK